MKPTIEHVFEKCAWLCESQLLVNPYDTTDNRYYAYEFGINRSIDAIKNNLKFYKELEENLKKLNNLEDTVKELKGSTVQVYHPDHPLHVPLMPKFFFNRFPD